MAIFTVRILAVTIPSPTPPPPLYAPCFFLCANAFGVSEEIEREHRYNPTVDSPSAAASPAVRAPTSTSRVQDLKVGIAMKPPTPSSSSHHTSESPFIRSQAPPAKSQITLGVASSTQSTERTCS